MANSRIPVAETTARTKTAPVRTVFDGGDHRESAVHVPGESKEHSEKEQVFLEVLRKTSSSELKRVQVEVCDGCVSLDGQVSSFYLKQLAQETLRPYAIGLQICNRIEVVG